MTRLSELVDESLAKDLRNAIDDNQFPGVTFRQAMELLLSDGIIPASGLPVESVLNIETWARRRSRG